MNTESKEAVKRSIIAQHKRVRQEEKNLEHYRSLGRNSLIGGQQTNIEKEKGSLDALVKTLPKAEQDEIMEEMGLVEPKEDQKDQNQDDKGDAVKSVKVAGKVAGEPENATGPGTKSVDDPIDPSSASRENKAGPTDSKTGEGNPGNPVPESAKGVVITDKDALQSAPKSDSAKKDEDKNKAATTDTSKSQNK